MAAIHRHFVTLVVTLVVAVAFDACVLAQDRSSAGQVVVDMAVANPQMLADEKQTTFVKVELQGLEPREKDDRPPVNVALVIDRSGSMQGNKMEQAKLAAIAAVDRLRADDILSVVAYHDGVQTVLPAMKLSEKDTARTSIRTMQASGSTALFAGVSKGAAEVRKFRGENRISRVILLSDGRANIGPDSASELGELGASLLKENIAVTTLGLGLDYNEDLMMNLAMRSNGIHLFIEDAEDLVTTFHHELDNVLSVVAQEISIQVQVHEGIRPVRVLGREADIHGQQISMRLNQLYASQERFVLIELEVPPTASGTKREIAEGTIRYVNMLTGSVDTLSGSVSVTFTNDTARLKESKNREVEEKATLLVANERNRRATFLRDQGKIDEARQLLESNYVFLRQRAQQLNSPLLRQQTILNQQQAENLDGANWQKTRKLMLRDNAAVELQSPGFGGYEDGAGVRRDEDFRGYGGGYGDRSFGSGEHVDENKRIHLDVDAYGTSDTQIIKTPHETKSKVGTAAPAKK